MFHIKLKRAPEAYLAIALIVLGLLSRGLLMESTDLLDPTESRYASVAQEMVGSGNWLTPMLPMPEGLVPYMGKPPLHFWLTALSYRLFGVEEWTSRLPSFLAALGVLGAIFMLTRRIFSVREAIAACAIAISSVLLFFLAGASVTDVTLTLTVTASIAFLSRHIRDGGTRPALIAAAFAGLGFLCKGPVSLILIWSPFAFWSLGRRDFTWMGRMPWFRALAIFLGVTLPWFVASEIAHPGFVRYFFWNENVARYLFKEYGDRYGSGHVHPYGTAWLLLFGAFAPWSVALLFFCFAAGRKRLATLQVRHPELGFLACWALTPPLFFTFVRQLHIMYLLPSIPPLAILTSVIYYRLLPEIASFRRLSDLAASRILVFMFPVIWAAEILLGVSVDYSIGALAAMAVLATVGMLIILQLRQPLERIALTSTVPALLMVTYLIAIGGVTPFLAEHQSAELALKSIPRDARCQNASHTVGVTTENTFSHYWTAKAWENELEEKLTVQYVAPGEAAKSDVCHLLIEAKHVKDLSPSLRSGFDLVAKTEGWWVFGRRTPLTRFGISSPSRHPFAPL